MKAILVATDGSHNAREAVAFATDLARDTGATLHVLSVQPPRPHLLGGAAVPDHVDVAQVHTSTLIAQQAAEVATEAGVRAEAHEAEVDGHEAAAIVRTAEELGAEMIVIGSRGRGAVGAAILGSVSNAVIKHSKLPVTVVRGEHMPGAAAR